MSRARGQLITLHEPEVERRTVTFRWSLDPPSELYRRTSFRLAFPEAVAIERVPLGLWWRLGLICIYPQLALLAPCRVELPIALGAREREFWLRMLDAMAANIAAYGGAPWPRRLVEIVDAGPPMPPRPLESRTDRVTAAFSGGKDSLVQAALLAELGPEPILVTVRSPVDWSVDHASAARDRAIAGIERRRSVEVVSVDSDFRSCWNNDFALSARGYRMAVNELCDVLLYQACTLAVAAAAGSSRAFLAAEAELQYNARVGGSVVQHPHFTCSGTTQAALSALLAPHGLGIGSLTCPLHMPQVMSLLWRRYRDLADLQFSCWQAADGAQACSGCGQCSQVGLAILSEGFTPRPAGIDPVSVLLLGDSLWPAKAPQGGPALHPTRSPHDKYHDWLAAAPPRTVAAILERDTAAAADPRRERALASYAELHARVLARPLPPPGGYAAPLLELVPDDLREPLRAIFDRHLDAAPDADFAAMLARARLLAGWISAPLCRR
ncbi:MAG TPA: hypothetical protein VL977_00355 [Solirubrobacteraceae bacterium]|nr:hypothetical protein [Solirubrobacteraceae bacterium]